MLQIRDLEELVLLVRTDDLPPGSLRGAGRDVIYGSQMENKRIIAS